MLEHCKFFSFSGLLESRKLESNKIVNALAHILPKIGRVTCLFLKNVRDLDVEGHASIVQGLWQCH